MKHSYAKNHLHIVFATDHRLPTQPDKTPDRIISYAHGIAANLQCSILAMAVMPDHVHILAHLHPSVAPSEFIGKLKGNLSRWISKERVVDGAFSWQRGYSAFSVSESALEKVKQYIDRQGEHHREISFSEEVSAFLNVHGFEAE